MSALLQDLVNRPYRHGFVTDIESDVAAKGLTEDTIRLISAKKNEPEWLLEFRLKAFRHWLTMTPPEWANVKYPKIDFQAISYYSAPRPRPKLASMEEVDPELLRTFEKLGVPMHERAALAGEPRSRPPTTPDWPTSAPSSARSRRRCRTPPSWSGSTSAPWCRAATTTTRR